MSSIHVARQGFVTKSALPSVSRVRGTTQVADNRTVLLLNGNGTNGAQNNTFIDSSTNNFTITRNGNATQGSFSPFTLPDGQWSNFFDGTGDYLSIARNSAFLPVANEDFTFEAWVYPTATPGATEAQIMGLGEWGQDSDWLLLVNSSLQLALYLNSNTTFYRNTTQALTLNAWNHVAVSRSGTSSNNLRVFVNGVGQSFTTNVTTILNGNRNLTIGADQNGDESNFTGYISNARIVKGTGIYTANFTPSTTSLTAITNTSLLTCQSNRFRDNSSNNFAITRTGDVRVTPWSPFAPTSAYSPSVNGGSAFFDGTGDFLTVPDSDSWYFGTGDFTVEGWIYYTGTNNRFFMFSQVESFSSNNNRFMMYYGGTAWTILHANSTGGLQIYVQANDTLVANTWIHMAFVKSGTTFSVYRNGVLLGSGTDTDEAPQINSPLYIGTGRDDGVQMFTQGYISNFRVVKGTAVYTSAFAPPTAPVTNITNTSLLLNFTNAGIFDTAGDTVVETLGNAQISTSIKRYGTGSIYVDGNGDYLFGRYLPDYDMGNGDFTVECWAYPLSAVNSGIVRTANASSFGGFAIGWTSGSRFKMLSSTNGTSWAVNSDSAITSALNTWHHVAMVRSGSTMTLYVNGVSQATASIGTSSVIGGLPLYVGWANISTEFFNGYIDDVRITKGQARYTANFTPPTAELIVYGTSENIVNNSTYGVYQLA